MSGVIVVGLMAFVLGSCESNQARVARLQKASQDLDAQYRRECFDPYSESSGAGVNAALHGPSPSAQQKAEMERNAREQQARINSPHCQELAKRQKEAAQAWNAALQ
jgi:hypothetical protein